MTTDIFSLFKNSIEKVDVKSGPRGTFEPETPTFNVSIDAIVKRRIGFAEEVAESEDLTNNTTIHFRPTDAQYLAIGNFVKVDGLWHSIIGMRPGKNFHTGAVEFYYVVLGDEVSSEDDDPVWPEILSA